MNAKWFVIRTISAAALFVGGCTELDQSFVDYTKDRALVPASIPSLQITDVYVARSKVDPGKVQVWAHHYIAAGMAGYAQTFAAMRPEAETAYRAAALAYLGEGCELSNPAPNAGLFAIAFDYRCK